jgi:hypothetical protein
MIRHLAGLSAATVLVAVCLFLPFMPGEYDGFAATLSAWAQLVGTVGLLLVPIGAIWLGNELRIRGQATGTRPARDLGHALAWAALAVASLVSLGFATVAWGIVGRSLGFAVLALWLYCAFRLARRLKAMRQVETRVFNPAPLYLIVVPVVAAILTFTQVGRAIEFSRNRAIENSAQLIHDIERYRESRGHYPPSLLALHQDDYKPSVIGIDRYQYEPHGDGYNLFFEQLSNRLGTREFVVYNTRDEHAVTSHAMDLLQLTPAELAYQRGYYAVNNAQQPHWKYFWFD